MSTSVFYYEPFYDFERFFDTFNSRVPNNNQVQHRHADHRGDGAIRSLKPKMDLHENGEKNLVTATFELPGLKKQDVNIDVQNGRLIISAETKISSEYEQSGYAVRERAFGTLSRTLQLPQGINLEEIKASMEDGILTITFPKSAPEVVAKKIRID